MTLWTLLYPLKGKVTVMLIKDRKKTPAIVGELTLRSTSAGPRPLRFLVSKDKKQDYRAPEEFIEILRRSERILITRQGNAKTHKKIIEMLGGFHLTGEMVDVCRFCLLNKEFNFVNKKSISHQRERICETCAQEELKRALRNSQCHYSDEAIQRIFDVLNKTKDLDRTIGMLDPEEIDSEVTRYDTIASKEDQNPYPISKLPISGQFKKSLLKKSKNLLPVQSIAVRKGLLKGNNLLVTSATATGKTLIGEMAGIENILKKRGKMLYLVPLVALANQKYSQFTGKYEGFGLQTSIRIGSSRIKTRKTEKMSRSLDTDLIVGTYEGIDYIMRSSKADMLGQIGTVVIDEVHMLEDEERGHRLDGVIARLKYAAPGAQFIYLSATVGSPHALAKHLDAELVEYEHRPVPIERHLIFCPQQSKLRIMTRLIREEYNRVSSKGHKGQTIVFTNSRRNCHRLANALPIQASAYHAGLANPERKKVEDRFASGKLPVVVTTAALAAGVDFPASQVIFESLAMGIDWINLQEFLQMLGRAGRPDYHDRGVVVLLASPDKTYGGGQAVTEDEMAVKLLKGRMEEMNLKYGQEEQEEEVLASVAVTNSKTDLNYICSKMVEDIDLNSIVNKLKKYRFLTQKGDGIKLTRMGSIAARHFLSASRAFLIRDAVRAGQDPIEIAANLEFFDAVYFKFAPQISAALNVNMPSRVFQGAALDIVFEGDNLSQLEEKIRDQLFEFATDFLTCGCKESPYCGCAEKNFSEMIIRMRAGGRDPEKIAARLNEKYGISAYVGDLYGYLDGVIRNLDAIEMMASAHSKPDIAKQAKDLKKSVEAGR
ncbi:MULTISPECIES: DUF5814 domain-containing protein [Methanohalophilus]|jgi:helicase|uniref:Helicase n=1 Tax=Methanohalophilus euhalobius TaxID=51203 RepID=A0A285EM85_9EURY|nr:MULTISPECIES: DUF5814 domain-containing protein [Methanohalophilus]OBZ35366.1 MAG: DEAD/DEAH box helicase [Methanohalophilus sp. DAL1]PQV43852.1 helicase [Methanohalophilus euhalobius]RNI11961.1 DEAD/DEAH box helicase [Methanohalophilus euhalobius]TCL11076.1 helicase [Methanohalophilus euhalobius]SNX99943.1 helicase [Methanohalophilus euhalobius]